MRPYGRQPLVCSLVRVRPSGVSVFSERQQYLLSNHRSAGRPQGATWADYAVLAAMLALVAWAGMA